MPDKTTMPRTPARPGSPRPVSVLAILLAVNAEAERLETRASAELREWISTLSFAIRRERNKSMMRHWSYDLNRHIALKHARDRLRCELSRRERNAAGGTKKAASVDAALNV